MDIFIPRKSKFGFYFSVIYFISIVSATKRVKKSIVIPTFNSKIQQECYDDITSVYQINTSDRRLRKSYYKFALTNLRLVTLDERRRFVEQQAEPIHYPYLLYNGFEDDFVNTRYVHQYYEDMSKTYILDKLQTPETFCMEYQDEEEEEEEEREGKEKDIQKQNKILTCINKLHEYGFQGSVKKVVEFAYYECVLADLNSEDSFWAYEYLKHLGENIGANYDECYNSIIDVFKVNTEGQSSTKKYYEFAMTNLREVTPTERRGFMNQQDEPVPYAYLIYDGLNKIVINKKYVFEYYYFLSNNYLLVKDVSPDKFCSQYPTQKNECLDKLQNYGFQDSVDKIVKFAYETYVLEDLTGDDEYFPYQYLEFLGTNVGVKGYNLKLPNRFCAENFK